MKKLLLLLAVVFSTVACENLSDELATANDRITLLEGEINSLEQQLQDSINANTITAQQLVDAQAEITALLDQLETAYEANINLGNINGELWEQLYALEAQIADLNNQIASLQGQLADALEADELNIELISSLNDQIAELEAREPEVIVEYITVVETIVETITETVYVDVPGPTVYENTDEYVQTLLDRISELEAALADLTPEEEEAEEPTAITEADLTVTDDYYYIPGATYALNVNGNLALIVQVNAYESSDGSPSSTTSRADIFLENGPDAVANGIAKLLELLNE